MALGQNAGDVLSLEICLQVYSVILENPNYPLTFYIQVHVFIHGEKQQPVRNIQHLHVTWNFYIYLCFKEFSIFTDVMLKLTAKSCHKYQVLQNESLRKMQIIPNSTQEHENIFHLLRTNQHMKSHVITLSISDFLLLPPLKTVKKYLYILTYTIPNFSKPQQKDLLQAIFPVPREVFHSCTLPLTIIFTPFFFVP